MASEPDFIVIGAGSAGCAVAASLARHQAGRVMLVEAGPTDRHPLVRMPFGLVWLMNGRRDWRYRSSPMQGIGGRQIAIPRGRMLGGSSAINSMVWFRGRAADFDDWKVPGWTWGDVAPAFDEVEAFVRPAPLAHPHPLTLGLASVFADAAPTPERESAGVFSFNLHDGRRWSAADAFLGEVSPGGVEVVLNRVVRRLGFDGDTARRVYFDDGTSLGAVKGIILSAGAIGSPDILFNSGIGPADDLRAAGRDARLDAPGIGANLHDHPAVGMHFSGPGSGYGLSFRNAATWAAAPALWAFRGRGVFASPTVEGGAFFDSFAAGGAPDVQCHFIPFQLGWQGRRIVTGDGYFADVCVCRPVSRGRLRPTATGIEIDLGLLSDPKDTETLVRGFLRLRDLLGKAEFAARRAPEVFPGPAVLEPSEVRAHIRDRAATAYHPVGTLAMGEGDMRPVTPGLKVKGVEGLWIADASVMPSVTSANTNAPSMMIGHRAGRLIAEQAA